MRINGIFILAVAVCAAAFAVPSFGASLTKVGVIDLQKALNATSEGLAAKESLRQKHQGKQEQVDAMKAELDSMEEKIKSPVVSEAAQAELKERYRRKRDELLEFVASAKEEEERENQALSSRILEGLIGIAREIAESEGYTMVLETNQGGLIYFQETMDLTERTVRIYNERHQAGEGQ